MVDYRIIDKILLNKAWKFGYIFVDKIEKGNIEFVDNWFVKKAKKNL